MNFLHFFAKPIFALFFTFAYYVHAESQEDDDFLRHYYKIPKDHEQKQNTWNAINVD